MGEKAFQDYYPDHLSYCYGCGRLNEQGLKIRATGMVTRPSAGLSQNPTTSQFPAGSMVV